MVKASSCASNLLTQSDGWRVSDGTDGFRVGIGVAASEFAWVAGPAFDGAPGILIASTDPATAAGADDPDSAHTGPHGSDLAAPDGSFFEFSVQSVAADPAGLDQAIDAAPLGASGNSADGYANHIADSADASAAPRASPAVHAGGEPAGGGDLAAPLPAYTISEIGDYVKEGFWDWWTGSYRSYNMSAAGTGANSGIIYYDYDGFSGITGAGTDTDGISAARRALVDDALDYIGELLGINFIHSSSPPSGGVDLYFKDTGSGANANSSLYGSGNGSANHRYIDYSWVNIAPSWSGGTSDINDYTYQTIIHEIGHALGLGHAGPYDGNANYITDTTQATSNNNAYLNDSWQQAIMSYFDQDENTYIPAATSFNYVISFMAGDWEALRDYYGSSSAFNGNTVYGFNTNIAVGVSETFANLATWADETAFCIIDSDGNDTLDFSGYAAHQKIDITIASGSSTIGTISNIGGETGNMTLGVGTIIENAFGGSGNDTITGNTVGNDLEGRGGNDSINGGNGNDTVDGGTGADTLWGGFGDDLYIVDSVGDVASEVAGGIDTVQSSVTHTLTVNLENLTLTGSAVNGTGNGLGNIITGNGSSNGLSGLAGNDSLYGGSSVDTLYGGTGDDLLRGGFSTDTVYGEDGNDTIQVLAGEFYDNADGGTGTDTLNHSASTYFGDTFDFEAGLITGTHINGASATLASIETYQDGSGGNTIVSDGNGNRYYGNGGGDYMIAETGSETMDGGTGTDTIDLSRWNGAYTVNMATGASSYTGELYLNFEYLISGNGADSITGTIGDNAITTNGGNDTVNAGDGNDTVNAGDGDDRIVDTIAMFGTNDDVINGGAGIDTFVHELNWASTVSFDLTAGYSTYNGNRDQLIGIENLTVGGNASVNGSAVANVLIVNGTGSNSISGQAGNDTVNAGGGDDTINGGDDNDSLFGGDGNDSIDGGNGNDTVDGGTGTDTLWGGFGDDLYIVDNVGDVASEVAGGIDTVQSSVTHTLTANLENLTLTGGAINGTGNGLGNIITGNGSSNVLSGLAGNDSLYGGGLADTLYGGIEDDLLQGGFVTDTVYGEDGNDTIRVLAGEYYDNVDGGAGIDTLDHSAATYAGDTFDFEAGLITGPHINGASATLASIEIYQDGSGGNTIVSDGNGNSYYGNGGADYMIAEIGSETMDGGTGTDTIDLSRWNGTYTVNMATGASSYTGELYLNFEYLISGNGADSITGTIGDNAITTNGGDDTVRGGDGNDTVNGGDDNDRLFGDADDDSLYGDMGNDTLTGGTGSDTLGGGDGNDTYVLEDGDQVNEAGGAGTDLVRSAIDYTLNGNCENLTLFGGDAINGGGNALDNVMTGNGEANILRGRAGTDSLLGLGGVDVLSGGEGDDTLTGGGAQDTFYFDVVLDAATNIDSIVDFSGVDQIRLDQDIFTQLALGALAAGAFKTGAFNEAQDGSDRIVYNSGTGNLFYDADGQGGAAATQFATLTGAPAITAADFFVVT